MSSNIQKILVQELNKLYAPLNTDDTDLIFELIEDMGWNLKPILSNKIPNFIDAVKGIIGQIDDLKTIIETPPRTIKEFKEIFLQIKPIINDVKNLKDCFNHINGIQVTEYEDFPLDFFNKMFVLYIHDYWNQFYHFGILSGFIHYENRETLTDTNHELIKFNSKIPLFDFNKSIDFFSDPAKCYKNIYWSNGLSNVSEVNEVAKLFFFRLSNLLRAFDISTGFSSDFAAQDFDSSTEEKLKGMFLLEKTFFQSGNRFNVGTMLQILSTNDGGPGLVISPFGDLVVNKKIRNWELTFNATNTPDEIIITKNNFQLNSSENKFAANLNLLNDSSFSDSENLNETLVDFGKSQFQSFILIENDIKYGGYIQIKNGQFQISPKDGDGFLSKIIPAKGVKSKIDFKIGWTNTEGFHFEGSGDLSLTIPIKIENLEFLSLKSITLKLGASTEDGLELSVSTTGSVHIGAITAFVKELGLKSQITFPESDANLGILNLDLDFKPPTGIGLSIDAEKFNGSGYLNIGENKYSGFLQIKFGKINFTVLGILNTKLPDNQEGYSLLLLVTVEGFKPIQLGAGFTLTGVGGLLGLNRTANIEFLRDGLKTGVNEDILFPTNVVERADTVIANLDSAFPIDEGRFLFGPMFKLGWGSGKNIITGDIGLIIELPQPIKVIILGVIRAVIGKSEDTAPLVIKCAFMGAFEQEKKMISFDASIFGSKLKQFTLYGDLAFRLVWGDSPNFLVTVGGFHPSYTPPPLDLPSLNRLTISIINSDKGKVVLQSYFALTSNTVQIGASIEAKFKIKWGYELWGFLGFDALFQFNPFKFVIELNAGFAIVKNGKEKLSLQAYLKVEGPGKWLIVGRVKIKVFGIKLKLNFSKTFGKSDHEIAPAINVSELLQLELEKQTNWISILPENSDNLVTFAPLDTGDLVVDPFGQLQFEQKLVPLNLQLQKFGNNSIDGASYFNVTSVKIGGNEIDDFGATKESFAPADFQNMSDGEKLSRPSFVKYDNGITINGDNEIAIGQPVNKNITYETVLIDADETNNDHPDLAVSSNWLNIFRKGSAISKSALSIANQKSKIKLNHSISVKEEVYKIVNILDFTPIGASYNWESGQEKIQELISSGTYSHEHLELVPAYEAEDEVLVAVHGSSFENF